MNYEIDGPSNNYVWYLSNMGPSGLAGEVNIDSLHSQVLILRLYGAPYGQPPVTVYVQFSRCDGD